MYNSCISAIENAYGPKFYQPEKKVLLEKKLNETALFLIKDINNPLGWLIYQPSKQWKKYQLPPIWLFLGALYNIWLTKVQIHQL